jgi:hypothetical protein
MQRPFPVHLFAYKYESVFFSWLCLQKESLLLELDLDPKRIAPILEELGVEDVKV